MTRVGPFGYDEDDLADSEWSEIVGAQIGRVDLVGASANGSKFLLMKSQQNNLMAPDQIRALITSAETERPMNSPKMTNGQILAARKAGTLRKASKPSIVAVYSADGKLVGTVDQAKITVLASVSDPDAPYYSVAPSNR